jgi:hypothetical protein
MGESGRRYLTAHLDKQRVIDFYEQTLFEIAGNVEATPAAAGQRT